MKPVVDTYEIDKVQVKTTKSSMANTQALDQFSNDYKLEIIPDCVFDKNKIVIETPVYQLNFSSNSSLQFLNMNFLKNKLSSENMLEKLNFVFENDVKVKQKEIWDNMKKDHHGKIECQNLNQDWTYINHYQGDLITSKKYSIVKNQNQIPVERLGVENPILYYQDIFFHEDDLGDFGYSRLRIRFRVQKDCIFILMNSYIRVDMAIIRAKETRYFIDFQDQYSIIRQIDCLEGKWEELIKKGFKFDNCFNIDLEQAEKVMKFLNKIDSYTEKITFNNQ